MDISCDFPQAVWSTAFIIFKESLECVQLYVLIGLSDVDKVVLDVNC